MHPDEVRVTGFRSIEGALPRGNGDQVIGAFDCVLPAVALFGCILIRRADRTLFARPPQLDRKGRLSRVVQIRDEALWQVVVDRAREAHELMGARHG